MHLRASDTGKSHFCEAVDQLAIDTGRTVAWFSIGELGALVRRHRADDIGMLPVGEDAAVGFHRLVDACYEKRSLAVSSTCTPPAFSTRSCIGHRHHRPATPPRARLRHRRSVLPTRASNHRQWGDPTTDLNLRGEPTTAHGVNPWPPVGRTPDRQRGHPRDR